jgi:hypothetical protein
MTKEPYGGGGVMDDGNDVESGTHYMAISPRHLYTRLTGVHWNPWRAGS